MPTNKRVGTDTEAVTSLADGATLLVISTDGTVDQHITGANLKAQMGVDGSPYVTETITGDGVSATFDVTHNLGTKHVLLAAYPTVDGEPEHTTVRFRPADTNGTNVVTVTIDQWGGVADAVVPDGVEVPVYVWPANGVQDFSSYTLDNTPGAGSYVPYVDPTEAIAADRNKRLLISSDIGVVYIASGETASCALDGTVLLEAGGVLNLPPTSASGAALVTVLDPLYGRAGSWSTATATVNAAGASVFAGSASGQLDVVVNFNDPLVVGFGLSASPGVDTDWEVLL